MATEAKSIRLKWQTMLYMSLLGISAVFLALVIFWSDILTDPPNTTLTIRAIKPTCDTPDGFFVLRKLDDNHIGFKSITLNNKTLQLTFDSREQRAQAVQALSSSLPQRYLFVLHDDPPAENNLLHDIQQKWMQYKAATP